jgi:hypothetical protein
MNKGRFEISLQNWRMIFEENPYLWLIPYIFKSSNQTDGIEWKLKLYQSPLNLSDIVYNDID